MQCYQFFTSSFAASVHTRCTRMYYGSTKEMKKIIFVIFNDCSWHQYSLKPLVTYKKLDLSVILN